jgi:hypothetical protein
VELYTLSSRFLPRNIIGNFTSAIWTERYSSAGDVQLVVPATPDMLDILTPGTFLGLRGTSEIMILETQSIENSLLTVTGSSLTKFLNERWGWFKNTDTSESAPPTAELTANTTAGQLISSAVYKTVINPITFTGRWGSVNLEWSHDTIPHLALGQVDSNGESKELSVGLGPLYDSISRLAEEEGVGIRLYLKSATYIANDFELRFATYRGKNRTGTGRGTVRLSPQLDSLTDVKEIISAAEYKNVVYVSYKDTISTHHLPLLPMPLGFERRVIVVDAPDIYKSSENVPAFRERVARNAFANHIYIQVVDGKVSSKIDYEYQVDYGLGDIVELAGYTGIFSKARITEYIRSEDQFGTQEYPTLSVIDPLQLGYVPDLEPNVPDPDDPDGPDGPGDPDTPGSGDPDYVLDVQIDDDLVWDPDPDNTDSDYDWELDPEGRKRKRKIRKPAVPDPNPDPVPDIPPPPPPPGGDDGHPPTRTYIVTGYYPDQNNGEDVGFLEYGGSQDPVLRKVWIDGPEDPEATSSYYQLDRIPQGWSLDKSAVIIYNDLSKDYTDAYPWSEGYSYWFKDPTTNYATRLTETIPRNLRQDGPVFPEAHGYLTDRTVLWCGSKDDYRLYIQSTSTYPQEYLYADGTYSTDPDLKTTTGVDHGITIGGGSGPVELYAAWGGLGEGGMITNSEISRALFRDNFPQHMRWSPIQGPYPSPDGTKLVLSRRMMGVNATFNLQGVSFGGTFTITVGLIGNSVGNYYTTAPIAYNATAQQVWEALLNCGPHLQDPRLRGYPFNPYYIGLTALPDGGQMQLFFDDTGPNGVWITVDNSGMTSPGSGYGAYLPPATERGQPWWYICDHNGVNLEDLDLEAINHRDFQFLEWSPDSTKILGRTYSGRYVTYNVSTGAVTYPLDDYFAENPGTFRVYPAISPNGEKIVWSTNASEIWISDADGSNPTKLYTQTVDDNSTDQNSLVVSYSQDSIVWSFDSTKLAVVDGRDEAPVWIINVNTQVMTQIWPGTGWDNPDNQKWIYDMQNFGG